MKKPNSEKEGEKKKDEQIKRPTSKVVICYYCSGKGDIHGGLLCPNCNGKGAITITTHGIYKD